MCAAASEGQQLMQTGVFPGQTRIIPRQQRLLLQQRLQLALYLCPVSIAMSALATANACPAEYKVYSVTSWLQTESAGSRATIKLGAIRLICFSDPNSLLDRYTTKPLQQTGFA